MSVLVDTHLLIWAASMPDTLPKPAATKLSDPKETIYFSLACVWEIGIKLTLGRPDFQIHPRTFRDWCLSKGFRELPFNIDHIEMLPDLPLLHRDPFDRIMFAQAQVERFTLLTRDKKLAQYGSPVQLV